MSRGKIAVPKSEQCKYKIAKCTFHGSSLSRIVDIDENKSELYDNKHSKKTTDVSLNGNTYCVDIEMLMNGPYYIYSIDGEYIRLEYNLEKKPIRDILQLGHSTRTERYAKALNYLINMKTFLFDHDGQTYQLDDCTVTEIYKSYLTFFMQTKKETEKIETFQKCLTNLSKLKVDYPKACSQYKIFKKYNLHQRGEFVDKSLYESQDPLTDSLYLTYSILSSRMTREMNLLDKLAGTQSFTEMKTAQQDTINRALIQLKYDDKNKPILGVKDWATAYTYLYCRLIKLPWNAMKNLKHKSCRIYNDEAFCRLSIELKLRNLNKHILRDMTEEVNQCKMVLSNGNDISLTSYKFTCSNYLVFHHMFEEYKGNVTGFINNVDTWAKHLDKKLYNNTMEQAREILRKASVFCTTVLEKLEFNYNNTKFSILDANDWSETFLTFFYVTLICTGDYKELVYITLQEASRLKPPTKELADDVKTNRSFNLARAVKSKLRVAKNMFREKFMPPKKTAGTIQEEKIIVPEEPSTLLSRLTKPLVEVKPGKTPDNDRRTKIWQIFTENGMFYDAPDANHMKGSFVTELEQLIKEIYLQQDLVYCNEQYKSDLAALNNPKDFVKECKKFYTSPSNPTIYGGVRYGITLSDDFKKIHSIVRLSVISNGKTNFNYTSYPKTNYDIDLSVFNYGYNSDQFKKESPYYIYSTNVFYSFIDREGPLNLFRDSNAWGKAERYFEEFIHINRPRRQKYELIDKHIPFVSDLIKLIQDSYLSNAKQWRYGITLTDDLRRLERHELISQITDKEHKQTTDPNKFDIDLFIYNKKLDNPKNVENKSENAYYVFREDSQDRLYHYNIADGQINWICDIPRHPQAPPVHPSKSRSKRTSKQASTTPSAQPFKQASKPPPVPPPPPPFPESTQPVSLPNQITTTTPVTSSNQKSRESGRKSPARAPTERASPPTERASTARASTERASPPTKSPPTGRASAARASPPTGPTSPARASTARASTTRAPTGRTSTSRQKSSQAISRQATSRSVRHRIKQLQEHKQRTQQKEISPVLTGVNVNTLRERFNRK